MTGLEAPVILGIASAAAATAGTTASIVGSVEQGKAQRRAANAAIQEQEQQRRLAFEQMLRASSRNNQEELNRREQEAVEQARRRRERLQALGVLENRAGQSMTTGLSVDSVFQNLLQETARQDNLFDYNSKLANQNELYRNQDLQLGLNSTLNQLNRPVEVPNGLGTAVAVGGQLAYGASNILTGIDNTQRSLQQQKILDAYNAFLTPKPQPTVDPLTQSIGVDYSGSKVFGKNSLYG